MRQLYFISYVSTQKGNLIVFSQAFSFEENRNWQRCLEKNPLGICFVMSHKTSFFTAECLEYRNTNLYFENKFLVE